MASDPSRTEETINSGSEAVGEIRWAASVTGTAGIAAFSGGAARAVGVGGGDAAADVYAADRADDVAVVTFWLDQSQQLSTTLHTI